MFKLLRQHNLKILFVIKVGIVELFTWSMLTSWEVASVQVLGDYLDVILNNATLENVYMFMHQFSELFDAMHARDSCLDPKHCETGIFLH